MRHWLVRPDLMCEKHLLGEHVECHMFQGSMRGNISLTGFYEGGLFFGPSFLLHRHSELMPFIDGHRSPVTPITIAEAIAPWPKMKSRLTYPDVALTKEVVKQSRMTLVSRCGVCRSKHLGAKRNGEPYRYDIPSSFGSSATAVDTRSIHRDHVE